MRKVAPLITALIALFAASITQAHSEPPPFVPPTYVLKHPKHEHCRKHYVKRSIVVTRHAHGHRYKVRETVCRYVPPKVKKAAPSVPVALHAHLAPSFIQSPTNPFAVTYGYSASATVGNEPEPSLPAGVLSFYTDGALACAINVGGPVTGGLCSVTYGYTGIHTVTVIYTSGSTSDTEGDVEHIEPFGTLMGIGYYQQGSTLSIFPQVEPAAAPNPIDHLRLYEGDDLLADRCAKSEAAIEREGVSGFTYQIRPAMAVEAGEAVAGYDEIFPEGAATIVGCAGGGRLLGPLVTPEALSRGRISVRVIYNGEPGWLRSEGATGLFISP